MRLACIDTHALVWYLTKPSKLGKAAARLLREVDRGRVEVLVPAIVGVELALLREAGRRVVGPAELGALVSAQPAFRIQPIDLAQVVDFSLLSAITDPFDRMIIAAARVAGAPLITADEAIESSPWVTTIWD